MSYTVLARRYRSSTFDDLIGQGHVAQTLKKAIESGRIAHAYLFCGTRGTGKTSTARILAKGLNCEKSKGPTAEPCAQCESCQAIARGDDIDVIEIDAASNTGVDNIRELIENSQYRPARSRFKVYIIDEVHMLSKSAFNALLKTLEEPPEHVKFILATTEPEKVLPTILSRCQRYDFRNIPTREIAGHLKEICKKEKISADDDALLLIAKAGAGSMRDSLSLLDRLLSIGEKTLDTALVEQLLGLPKSQLIFDLADAIGRGDVKATLMQADAMVQSGQSVDGLLAALVDHLRNLLILRTCGADSGLVEVPGLSPVDLNKQAGQFDPVALTQDITILEELRRQIRQSQAGRALLDASLVRLALAEQFASVSDLLLHVDGNGAAGGVAAQKKKFEPVAGSPSPAVRQHPEVERSTPYPNPLPQRERETDPAPEPTMAPVSSSEDEDDDLPRPGKVWDNSGPSLSELLKQHSGGTSASPPKPAAPPREASTASHASSSMSNIEPVDESNLPEIWRRAIGVLSKHGPGVPSLLAHARFAGVIDDKAVIRYSKQHETFVKMFERNGKKDQVREAFSEVVGKSLGVMFEIEAPVEAPEPQPAAGAAPGPARSGSVPSAPAPTPAPAPAPAPAPSARLTPEQKEQLAQDPLIRAMMNELGAEVVRLMDESPT